MYLVTVCCVDTEFHEMTHSANRLPLDEINPDFLLLFMFYSFTFSLNVVSL